MENKVNRTIYCTSCNAELPLGLKFCTECGKPVQMNSDLANENSNQKSECPNCSVEVSPDSKFCAECGTSLLDDYSTHENVKKGWYLELIKKELQ